MGNVEEALVYMKKAVAVDPENATYRYQVNLLENEIAGKDNK
jgi:hypothetical protein